MSLQVDHCPKCGSVYRKNARSLCGVCSAQQDRELNRCLDHLWKFPDATTDELSDATNIAVSSIYRFIKEGKLPRGCDRLTYPCECCGAPIHSNRLCGLCTISFKQTAAELRAKLIRAQPSAYQIYK
ncbi:flagellar protein [Paenibacillus sp. GYB003]|uniref:flagellar protein n=1 Tax=Paenibacillus sp. GYB003 TaxID=2994392 RepID=UPI002F967E54